jgi:hypothetical protein
MATVTVQSCSASGTASGNATITAGQTASIFADLTGTPPWNVTWSDGVTQSGLNQSHSVRNVTPVVNTNYTITSVVDGTGCNGSRSGTASVTVINLPAPTTMVAAATTTSNATLTVALQWSAVAGASWYQVERATRLALNDWQPILRHQTLTSAVDTFGSTPAPVTYLYRVRAGVTNGGSSITSSPSPIDYATVATTLFTDEPLTAGVTSIKGAHLGELRKAIDAVRYATGTLSPSWNSYAAATGPTTANDNITARQSLDQAVNLLVGHGVGYSGETPALNSRIWAYQLQQIRNGVR